MEYRVFGAERAGEVREIYRDAGWNAYLRDDAALLRALERSLYLLGAFDGERLVGFVRCVGDGEHIVYVQDLIVHSEHQRRGVGTALLRMAMEEFGHVRMLNLITDAADEGANAFYARMGMKRFESNGIAGYFR